MISKKQIIYEKTPIIQIKQNSTDSLESPKGEYSLKQSFFDPSKSSPPNEFMLKLHMRMSRFITNTNYDQDE